MTSYQPEQARRLPWSKQSHAWDPYCPQLRLNPHWLRTFRMVQISNGHAHRKSFIYECEDTKQIRAEHKRNLGLSELRPNLIRI
jgi:hypothetical protein